MVAIEAEVISEDVSTQLFPELRTNNTSAQAASKAAEEGTRYRAEGDSRRSGNRANERARLGGSQCGTNASCGTAHRVEGCSDFPSVMEGVDFG